MIQLKGENVFSNSNHYQQSAASCPRCVGLYTSDSMMVLFPGREAKHTQLVYVCVFVCLGGTGGFPSRKLNNLVFISITFYIKYIFKSLWKSSFQLRLGL
ncbi:hypothetical protein ATANTOWER_022190 [Ataeniobius toweri]|uniref:Uncharacterized protein n=1 Tax=Ataeniobius toweri TaxID=208326 RepID=A0ABU7B1V2_9TELE|nr:hypothetical protein [Ataeniobius toweri]